MDNIAVINDKNSIFTGRDIPAWHRLGTTIAGTATWKEAIKLANLDWLVEKQPLYNNKGDVVPVWGIFRDIDNAFLGAVGERYNIIQNEYAFEFVDALIESNGAHYDTAGALGKGEVIFCSAYLPSAGFEVVPDDKHEVYLLFKTSHDGTLSASCKLTDIRVVCQNTLNQALSSEGKELKIRHTKNAKEKMELAKKLITGGQKTAEMLCEKMRQLSEKRVTRESLEKIMTRLFPTNDDGEMHTKTKNNIIDVLNLYESNDNNQFPQIRGSAYNLLNACIEYADKVRTARGGGIEGLEIARAESAVFGSGEKFKSDALDVIYEVANTLPSMQSVQTYTTSIVQNTPTGSLLDEILDGMK